jgi:ATP-binding cassette, subfamily B, bacterial
MSQKIPKNPFVFGLFVTKPHKKWAISAIFFVLCATGLDRASVIILKLLTDAIATHPIVFSTVWFWAMSYPTLFFIAETFFWRSSGFTGMHWMMNMRFVAYQSLYDYLSLHSKDYFSSRFSGSLTNKISNAVDGTQTIFESMLWRFLPLFLAIIWYIIFAWMSNAWLGLLIWVWFIIFLLINIGFARKLTPYSYQFAQSLSVLKGRLVDSLSNISLVHEYAYVAGERAYINTFVKKQRDAGLARWRLSEWMLVLNGLLICLFMFMMFGLSIYLLQREVITLGVIVMMVAIVVDLGNRLFFLGQEIRDAAKYYGEAKEGLKEILCEHTIVDAPHARAVILSKGEIILDSIDFDYENTHVFHNFSLTIPSGQKIGFVGRSGAGKTTFVSLLLRHFDVQQGNISIDGNSIYDIKLESLRRAIAFVPQDTSLFHRSIKENIRYSNPKATDDQVKQASIFAQADDFITRLPEGYSTLVGERGIKLSGGQRQRIAIARAFLKNAPILILDEATSSLDSESEQAIQESLETLMKGKTVIAVAHRLSTLKKMDRIVVIQDGKIVEDGLPEDLMKKQNGMFKKMWDHQVKGFIVDE